MLIAVVGSKQSQKQIDNILILFNSTYEQLEGESLRHLMVSTYVAYLIDKVNPGKVLEKLSPLFAAQLQLLSPLLGAPRGLHLHSLACWPSSKAILPAEFK